jgi:alcohol dehydrogenase (NADP+)
MRGGMPDTQQMLGFCAGHGIKAQIEVIAAKEPDKAYGRLTPGDVRYRFVLDASTIAEA